MNILDRTELGEADLKDIGRSSYQELDDNQQFALSMGTPDRLRTILDAAMEEPKNSEIIAIVAATSLRAAMQPNFMHLQALDAHEQSLDFMKLHQDAQSAVRAGVEQPAV